MSKNIVVVGGVAGGMSFATRYRRLNQLDKITVIDKGPYVSFANCGLPYYISEEISERDNLLVTTKEELIAKFDLNIKVNTEVVKVNAQDKSIEVISNNEVEIIEYDELILSVGAKPIYLNIENMESKKGIFTLRNIPDVDKIMNYLDNENLSSAVVIGAGFIGLEMAESLKNRGLKVSVVEKAPQVLGPLDSEMAKFAENELIKNGVDVYTDTSVVKFEDDYAILEDNSKIEADLVIMAVGVNPDTKFLEDTIELGLRNGIVVDSKFKTSDDNIYAVGDAIIVNNPINNQKGLIPLASPANRQGRQLADMLNGIEKDYKGSIGTSIVRIFDRTFASVGLNERALKDVNYDVIHLNANNHAGYFPNATSIYLKVIFDKDSRLILGAQALGKSGVDKRIDVIATAIKANYKVDELQELELSYAPPYGSAKDIVNMAGYAAENLKLNLSKSVQWYELEDLLKDGAQLVDVRMNQTYLKGHIDGAINIPLVELKSRLSEIDKNKKVIVSCQTSVASYNAERILKSLGYDVYNLDGGYSYYSVIKPESCVR